MQTQHPGLQPLYRTAEGQQALDALYSKALDELPFACQELDVQTESFGRAHVVVAGPEQAPPLMLWQGTGAPAPVMLADTKTLVAHYRVFAPDLPSQGGSRSDAVELDPGKHKHGRWCWEVMVALGLLRQGALAPFHVGISLGGAVLLDLATLAPETIRAAALVVPGGLHPDYGGWRTQLGLTLQFFLPSALYRLWPSRWTAWLALRGIMDEPWAEDTLVEQLKLLFRHVRYYPPGPGKFSKQQLRSCGAPMLVVTAEWDLFGDGASMAARAREVLPNSTAEMLPRTRHIPSQLKMEIVGHRILKFHS